MDGGYLSRLSARLDDLLARRPRLFPEAVRLGIMGFHFRAVTRSALSRAGL